MAYDRKQKHKTSFNSKRKFNPQRYGKVWGSITFEHDWDKEPVGEANGPVIGNLWIGNSNHQLTFSETNKLIETLKEAQHAYNVGVRMGRTNMHASQPFVR